MIFIITVYSVNFKIEPNYFNKFIAETISFKSSVSNRPNFDVTGLIDDIFDEGITLKAIVEELGKEKPLSIECCVLLNKEHDRKVADFDVDFVGINVDDRYVYGCGMDFHGYLRHLPGIYAIKEDKI